MDTTETYIKMCQKAAEIQKLFSEQVGDYLYMPKDGEVSIVGENYREYRRLVELKGGKSFAFDDPFVWLPRQDQLQEMLSADINKLISVFWNEMKWAERDNKISSLPMYIIDLKSMEQLWLAFVMKEKYGKTWNGSEWVKEVKVVNERQWARGSKKAMSFSQ